MLRHVRDALLLDLAVVVTWHVVASGARLWQSLSAPRPVIDETLLGRIIDEMCRP